jgi:hypothetical protein
MSRDAWCAKAADEDCEQYIDQKASVQVGKKCHEVSLEATVFGINVEYRPFGALNLHVIYKQQIGCSADVMTHKCTARFGIYEYAVELTNASIALQHDTPLLGYDKDTNLFVAEVASGALRLIFLQAEVRITREFRLPF